jgi:hypothetical protein
MIHSFSIATVSGLVGVGAIIVAIALIGFFLGRLRSPADRELPL